ncbi:TIGR03986 family type III CRISPR-associated RAMP protein [Nostoc sp.]|uniref:TIGR03986 family type III CRISPR-associated RAMP protein n=1 Tax=Nostoc sp. TaxID=1180 RepID=UPI002FFD0740
MLPRHLDKVSEGRKAKAPYNFVELPNNIVEVNPEFLPQKNIYSSDSEQRYTGKIKCILTTKSPLYIRCGLTKQEFDCGAETKDLSDFFYSESEAKATKPVIPGSSLRGMTRNLVEIISFSKITKVTDRKPFYRSLGDKALQQIYASNFIEESEITDAHNLSKRIPCYRSKVHAGFIRKLKNDNHYIIDECGYGRIDRNDIPYLPNQPRQPLYLGKKAGSTPNWKYQHQHIYVDIDAEEKNHFFQSQTTTDRKTGKKKERHPDIYLRYRRVNSASLHASSEMKLATLLITGDMQYKHLEFVLLHDKVKEYQVSDEVIQRFHDDDQITKWQEESYPKNKPTDDNSRPKNGYLRDGEPIFFLLNEDGETINFLGRAQMFRLPYNMSPYDFVPKDLCDLSKTDLADAIFGYVNGKGEESARAGRVFFGDATCISSGNLWYEENFEKTLTPKILASPKPTTFQHYLVQTDTDRKKLKHYSPQSDEATTVIRGNKLYWHKGSNPDIEHPDGQNAIGTQITKIKPIKTGISFNFDIHFENLSNVELGTMLWVLKVAAEPEYCLSLGMGKPLGMGAVKISHKLHLSDRTSRYSSLFNEKQWLTGEEDQNNTASKYSDCIKAFENYILDNIHDDDHPQGCKATKLEEIPRIQMLLAMLRCDNPPLAENTLYMTIEPNEYKDRPILPTPLQIMDIPDNRRCKNQDIPIIKLRKDKKSEKFQVGQILDARVTKINGVRVTYEITTTMQKLTEREPKKAASIQEEDIVKVKITALKEDGSIKNVKLDD